MITIKRTGRGWTGKTVVTAETAAVAKHGVFLYCDVSAGSARSAGTFLF
jgi:hypothetical protein